MQPPRRLLWLFSLLASTQLFDHAVLAAKCTVSTSSAVARTSVCDYAPQDLYVVDATQTQFPVGYRACTTAEESIVETDATCGLCACREKVIASVGGKQVAWAVCIDAEDAATCVSSEASTREFCGSSFSAAVSIDSIGSSATSASTEAWSTDSESPAVEEDNVIDASVPIESQAPTPTDTNDGGASIIRPSDKSSADELGTSNLAGGSTLSNKQLTALVAVACGIAAVAAIAIFVAIRKGRAEDKELRTPTEHWSQDFDLGRLGRPSTHHFTGSRRAQRYNPHHHTTTFNGSGFTNSAASASSDNVPFASIVVIGDDDSFHQQPGGRAYLATQTRQSSSRGRRHLPGISTTGAEGLVKTPACLPQAREVSEWRETNSAEPAAVRAALQRPHGASTASAASSRGERLLDTSNTGVAFSFDSVDFADTRDTAASEHLRASEDDFAFTTSSRAPPVIYEGCTSDAVGPKDVVLPCTTLEPTTARDTSLRQDRIFDSSNTVISFSSSIYADDRDTARIYESEDDLLRSNSSCIAISFDEGSPRRSSFSG